MFTQLFTFAAIAFAAQTVSAADCTRSYTIQAGDYCDKISQAQNVSTYQLAVVNSGSVDSSCSNLKPGASLCLANNAAEDCRTTYTVLPGDTCESVAAANALNTTILYLNNPQIDSDHCSNIYVGEVLCTSKTVQVAAIPAGGVTVVAGPGSSTTVVAPTAPSTPAAAATTTPPAVAAAALTPSPVNTPPAAANTPAPAAPSSSDAGSCPDDDTSANAVDDCPDDDEDDLPFCDEL